MRRRAALAAGMLALAAAARVRAEATQPPSAQPPSGPPRVGPPGAGPPASGPPGTRVVVREDSAQRTIACRGRPVVIRGDGNTLTLRGACPQLTVAGSDNVVVVDSARAIATTGHRNRVTYLAGIDGRVPTVADDGARNAVGPRI